MTIMTIMAMAMAMAVSVDGWDCCFVEWSHELDWIGLASVEFLCGISHG